VHCLVVHAHPDPESFGAALFATSVAALRRAGHDVRTIDLYRDGFQAAMTEAEHIAYLTDDPILDPQVRGYADDVGWADAMVFIYPTWWAGLPAILKGWLDRVLVNGVAFRHVEVPGGHAVKPNLTRLRCVVGISTYGSSRALTFLMADGGRRTLQRTLRLSMPVRGRRVWLGLYGADTATDEDRRRFLDKVDQRLASL
jgi:NAD(P)H dehydrogenase (quinone)